MAKGVYLYCVREKSDEGVSGEGIDGGKIFTIVEQGLEAVVSEVSLEEFSSKEIQRKAQEHLKWIKEKAQIHERVIEQAMGKEKVASVIPMKFGTIFKTGKSLEETVKKHHSQFREGLVRLKGKQEWAVKVYLKRKTFEEALKKASGVVQEKEREINSLPEGMAYFMQKQLDEAVLKEAAKTLENYITVFFENLKKYAEASSRGKILEKELTGKPLPMVLNAILLVSEQKLEGFKKAIDRLSKEYKPKGLHCEYSGPWPPYNFI